MKYPNSMQAGLKDRKVPDKSAMPSLPAPKQMIAYQIAREMARQKLTRQTMATRLGTSRAALNRLLDPKNESITLQTLVKAAQVLNLEMTVLFSSKN